jgi:serine/threonine protein kinase/predicted ATPase
VGSARAAHVRSRRSPGSPEEAFLPPPRIGPYRILGVLGRGGMGVVYRAEHETSAERVALKGLYALRQGSLAGLRREIYALSRIRHPGIVRIVDHGVEQGLPWYAMELLEGTTLRRHRAELATNAGVPGEMPVEAPSSLDPESLASILVQVRRLCAPLGYLHGEGIVHRDLKPENVLVRPDGWPVLVDFGLTLRSGEPLGREEMELTAGTVGTSHYMAPEQARGDAVDARADLYALGCVLFELLTGRPPFLGKSFAKVVAQHLDVPPEPPSRLVQGVPPQLDALVLRLLAKEPRARPGHADDVALALARLGAVEDLDPGPRPRVYLYRPGFVGRTDKLRSLEQEVQRMLRGQGGLVLVGGESGAGKTRLALELARKARARGVEVLAGEVRSGSAEPGLGSAEVPLGAMRAVLQSIADRCREMGVKETERLLGRRGKLLAPYEPALEGLPGQEAHPEPAELPDDAARLRLFSEFAETLAAFTQAKALVLVLDDLQWADTLTLGFLEFLSSSGRLEAMKLLVLGTYRTDEVGDELRMLVQRDGVRHLKLGRMAERSVGQMVCDMLALERPPRVFVEFLARHSEGNPFYVAQYLRTAVREGLLWRDPAGNWQVAESSEQAASAEVYEGLPLPDSVRELVGRRLERLGAGARNFVEIAAVLGREVDPELLAGLADLGTQEALEAQTELLVQQVLAESSEGRLRFVHDKIREVAYERIEPPRRRELHRAAAEALEAGPPLRRETQLAVLGHHWQEAGAVANARPYYLAAARKADRAYANGEAERLYRRYLQLVETPQPESIAARIELGKGLANQGRSLLAIQECATALAQARETGDRLAELRSLLQLGVVHRYIGQLEASQLHCEQALAVAAQAVARDDEATILRFLARVYHEQGRTDEAQSLYERAVALAREAANRKEEGLALGNLATLLADRGPTDQARVLYEQSLVIALETGDRRGEAMHLGNLAAMHRELGHLDSARTLCQQAVALAQEIGDRRFEATHRLNLAVICKSMGQAALAREMCEQALAIHREIGDRHGEGAALSSLADGYEVEGFVDRARALYRQALEIHREMGNPRWEGMVLRFLANLERRSGATGEALSLAEESESRLRRCGARLQLAYCLCERGHIELALGRPAEAQRRLEAAREIASELHAAAESRFQQGLLRLQGAIRSFESGEPLWWGDRPDDVPERLRQAVAREKAGAP